MKLAIGTFLIIFLATSVARAQTNPTTISASTKEAASSDVGVSDPSPDNYTVFNATAEQEAMLRAQIRVMHPDVLPLRIFFVPHWKYLTTARDFHLHVPTGYGSFMFTHLPSRTIFVDNDRYLSEDWLGHWIAHELGHLATNSTKEENAEKAAHEFRKRLKQSFLAKSH